MICVKLLDLMLLASSLTGIDILIKFTLIMPTD